MALQGSVVVEIDANSREDLNDMCFVHEVSREIAGPRPALFISLVVPAASSSSSAPPSLDFLQAKMIRAYVAAMEGCARVDVTVVPPVPHRAADPAAYLRPSRVLRPPSPAPTRQGDADIGTLPELPAPGRGVPVAVHDEACLGGTFDRLHAGHKLMFGVAAIVCAKKLHVGLTDIGMLRSKKHCEMIQSFEDRRDAVLRCMASMNPGLACDISKLLDPWGPSVSIREISAIVVSQETLRGADQINAKRAEAGGMRPLEVFLIGYVPPPRSLAAIAGTDAKLSSTALRNAEDAEHH